MTTLYRTKPHVTEYAHALVDQASKTVTIQKCDASGKATGGVEQLDLAHFHAKYEPARKPRTPKATP